MPGPYAHISLVNKLLEVPTLESIDGFAQEAKSALQTFFQYCELGAVSPDYPYLLKESNDAKRWADIMHYERNGEMVKVGIETLREMEGDDRDICLAWILGFASHVGMDTTVHPVIEVIGDYKTDPTEHRTCEIQQDSYIFPRKMNLEVTVTDHLSTGIQSCDIEAVAKIWSKMLQGTHPDEYEKNPPEFKKWHGRFADLVELSSHLGKFFLFGRHTFEGCGLLYPEEADINLEKYIKGVWTPNGDQDYDDVFDYAVGKVSLLWQSISEGLFSAGASYQNVFGNWNLDRGISEKDWESTEHGPFIMWEGKSL